MIFERRQLIAAAVMAAFAVFLIAGVLAASLGPGRRTARPASQSTAPPGGTLSGKAPSFTAVPPVTAAVADTPVQQQFDAALASGLSSSPGVQAAEAVRVPSPAFSPDWPPLPASDMPGTWAEEFTQRLLDIDFAHQSRDELGRWLSAEEAPESLPGVPAGVADNVLYLSLFDPSNVGGGAGPVPDQAAWQADAREGLVWSVSGLMVQPDPRFSRVVASGWQPADERFTVEDVSGVLTATRGPASIDGHFSMAVYLGSAHWHPGYGTVLVDEWKES